MLLLDPQQRRALGGLLAPERPGPLVAPHVLETGQGACFVDRWPDPRVAVAEVADNYAFRGDPRALRAQEIAERVSGYIEAPPEFEPLLREAFPQLETWERVILELDRAPPEQEVSEALRVRRLRADDAWQLFGLAAEVGWISKTQGGPAGLAASGLGWGGFVEGRLASVATPFYMGTRYEDVGVVTEARYRGLGLSPACTYGVVRDVLSRGRRVSWSTSPDNLPSLAVARKLGFREQRHDVLYLAGEQIPEPARKDP